MRMFINFLRRVKEKLRLNINRLFFVLVMVFYLKLISFLVLTMFMIDLFVRSGRLKIIITHRIKRMWIHITMAAFHIYFPNPIYICYDPLILEKTKNIVISNHQTEYDWLFILIILYRLNRFDDICIILKQSLRQIPLLGYGMQFFGFIFLNRKLSVDEQIIDKGISNLIKIQKYDLLLFPEGTYIEPPSLDKSTRFSNDNNIKVNNKPFKPNNVLLPRTSGFNLVKRSLLNDLDGIINITMLITPYEQFPQHVYTYEDTVVNFTGRIISVFYIDYISNKKEIDSENFLYNVFKEKDELIEKFKNLYGKSNFINLKDFKTKTKTIRSTKENEKYETLTLRSEWSSFFYTTFILGEILLVYFIAGLVKKIF